MWLVCYCCYSIIYLVPVVGLPILVPIPVRPLFSVCPVGLFLSDRPCFYFFYFFRYYFTPNVVVGVTVVVSTSVFIVTVGFHES